MSSNETYEMTIKYIVGNSPRKCLLQSSLSPTNRLRIQLIAHHRGHPYETIAGMVVDEELTARPLYVSALFFTASDKV